MKIYVLNSKQQLPISKEEAWTFFSDPSQLEGITSDDMSLKPMHDLPKRMYEGMIVRYQIEPFPKWHLQWVTEITHIKEGKYFIDEQRFGPFRFWHHQHRLIENRDGVELQDTVHYVMPFSIIGRIAHRLFVRKRLEGIFSYRKIQLEAYFRRKRS
ncbi:SRPBCC family protein [Virgibacillus sp. YIM 98842]|uniref:SRPBCC family protein n=1 Tax=Virgibacillus sp. YIM 98842 TaxID=2663533 RepID=UPI0013D9813F|nr:SRPBCC family protein [Virgibacillus sp. YIM 98842]